MVPRLNTLPTRAVGFTLLELAIVLVIVGILAGASLMALKAPIESTHVATTNTRLQTIRDALKAFKELNGRLPCPADPALATSHASYGVENGTIGTCTGGSVLSASNVVEGGIPFVALGLPAQFTYDGWGRRIVYAVYAKATRSNALLNYGAYTGAEEGISVQDASGSNRNTSTNRYVYLLMSYGKNGHGAYGKAGTRQSQGSTNTSELLNCHCDAAAATTAYSATYVDREATLSSASSTDSFDDIVLYQTFSQLRSKSDDLTKGSLPTYTTQAIDNPTPTGGTNLNFAKSVAMGDVNGDGYADAVLGSPNADNGATDTGSIFVMFGTPRGIPKDWSLATPNARTVVRFDGSATGMKIGNTLAVGDVNGDGYADIVTSAVNVANYEVYVVYGKARFSSATNTITRGGGGSFIDGTNGYLLTSTYFSAPNAIAIGRLNNDALNDIVVASSAYSSGGYGSVVAVFSKPTTKWSSTNTIDNTFFKNGRFGFLASSTTNIGFGWSIAIGDVNGDSRGDLLIGATYAGYGGGDSGSVFVIFGQRYWRPSYTEASLLASNTVYYVPAEGTIAFSTVPATNSTITLNGVTWTFVTSITGAAQTLIDTTGATDADKLANTLATLYTDLTASVDASLMIAKYGVSETTLKVSCKTNDTACDAYALARSAAPASNGTVSGATLNPYSTVTPSAPPVGLRFDGPTDAFGDGMLGWAVRVGDVNADGIGDVAVCAVSYHNPGGLGSVFVVLGTSAWTSFANTLDDAFFNAGTVGTRFDAGSRFGFSVAVGDFDNNGYADIFGVRNGGTHYVINGQATYAAASYTLESTSPFDTVNGTTLLKYIGSGTSMFSPATGDINGDGLVDVVMGAYNYNSWVGRAYIFYGQPYGWQTAADTY